MYRLQSYHLIADRNVYNITIITTTSFGITVVHNGVQDSSDNFPLYSSDNHHWTEES